VGTDKYHIQHDSGRPISSPDGIGKSALDEYDQYAVYLAILNHGAIDMFSVCSHLQ